MELSDGLTVGGLSTAGTLVLKYIIDNFVSSANAAKKKKEEDRDTKLEGLVESSARIETDLKLMSLQSAHSEGRAVALEKRVDGGLSDHRRRINRLETDMTVVKTTMKIKSDADIIEEGLQEIE